MSFKGGNWEGLQYICVKGLGLGEWFRIWSKWGERALQGGPPKGCQVSINPGQGHARSLESSFHYLLPNFKAMLLYNSDITAKDNFMLETIILCWIGWVKDFFPQENILFCLLIVESPCRDSLANEIKPFSLKGKGLRLPRPCKKIMYP